MAKIFKVFLAVTFGLVLGLGLAAILNNVLDGEGAVSGERIGVVPVRGFIGSSDDAVDALREFTEDDEVKAIVVRVSTPGGVVAPAQEIHDQIKRSAAVKPVVCSFGSVAASGGYYLSAPATRIVANPGSVTGSIGVILQMQNYQLLMDKLGLRAEAIKSGPYKDTGTPFREMGEEERAVMQALVDDIFQQFVTAVAEGRGMENEAVLKLADGRIYSGRQALELGLVDQLGGYRDAIELAGELGGILGEPRIDAWEKPKRGLLHLLLGPDAKTASEIVGKVSAETGASPLRLVLPGW
jgi:protease-4